LHEVLDYTLASYTTNITTDNLLLEYSIQLLTEKSTSPHKFSRQEIIRHLAIMVRQEEKLAILSAKHTLQKHSITLTDESKEVNFPPKQTAEKTTPNFVNRVKSVVIEQNKAN
jgi:hypothetical protein